MAPPKEFVFVDQSSGESVPRCPSVRRRIRQQAMKDAGQARRKRGNYGKHNLRQYPVFEQRSAEAFDAGNPQPYDDPGRMVVTQEEDQKPTALIVAQNPVRHQIYEEARPDDVNMYALEIPPYLNSTISAFEKLRLDYNFDLISLSALATSHFGRSSARAVQSDPSRLRFLVQQPEISYLQFIPSRYEESALLRDVVPCLLAQACWTLHPQGLWASPSIPMLYGKALRSLQAALSNATGRTHPDVLCATQLLSLFELLRFAQADRWRRHISGTAQLIKLRGPSSFTTEYEKAMLASQVGAMMIEASLSNESCFLEEEQWQPVISSLALDYEPFVDRSRIMTQLWQATAPVPGLFKRVTEYMLDEKRDPNRAMELSLRAYYIRHRLLEWRRQYDETAQANPATPGRRDKRCEILCVSMAKRIIINRLITALCPKEAAHVEEETQRISDFVVGLTEQATAKCARGGLLLAHKAVIAQAAIKTKDEWRQACIAPKLYSEAGRNCIDIDIFRNWCAALGRKIPAH